ncbi:MAG: hypothetical protein IPF93_14115 [Saprospiraceae bacterium]|nr:hypothetical protein [Saprospiraceae bacterium]
MSGLNAPLAGMQPMTGKSLTDIFFSEKEGKVTDDRDFVLVGKEARPRQVPHQEENTSTYKILNPIDGLQVILKRGILTVMAVPQNPSF